jgi:hypothetical protein
MARALVTVLICNSLRHLCVLRVSAVSVFEHTIHRRDAEVAETAQRKTEIRTSLLGFDWRQTGISFELSRDATAGDNSMAGRTEEQVTQVQGKRCRQRNPCVLLIVDWFTGPLKREYRPRPNSR